MRQITPDARKSGPGNTAVRVALWRALHVLADLPPHVFQDELGLALAEAWLDRLRVSSFDPKQPTLVASTGVSMYLTRDAITDTLRKVAALAPGSMLVMSFMLPIELADPDVRPGIEAAARGARANGTPFISFFRPEEMLALAREAGFHELEHVSAAALAERYFAGRSDGLRPPNNSAELLIANT